MNVAFIVRYALTISSIFVLSTLAIEVDTELHDGTSYPLVGVGLGNQREDFIRGIVEYVNGSYPILIDTAHKSKNEAKIAQAIVEKFPITSNKEEKKGMFSMLSGFFGGAKDDSIESGEKAKVFVITKVWYTHLGYERTKLSVEESLRDLKSAIDLDTVDLHVTVLLHWPRCNPEIEWMRCDEEEEELPDHVKAVGESPLKNPNAWKDSWKALEDLYSADNALSAIGVSNFVGEDIDQLLDEARVFPHIYQGSLWQCFHDIPLVKKLTAYGVKFSVYGTFTNMSAMSSYRNAHMRLTNVADWYGMKERGKPFTIPEIILATLVQNGFIITPRSRDKIHLSENSYKSIQEMNPIDEVDRETVEECLKAILDELDVRLGVLTSFENKTKDPIKLFWLSPDDTELDAQEDSEPAGHGETIEITSFPHHRFVVRHAETGDFIDSFQVLAKHGERTHFIVGSEL
mmetsp:Transcript_4539/g.6098  ORF Transcript_4539/g.6098 Transcript_4539/m.6098 type:complete len:459 (+) Transcript_4539:84-1460(+)|eukprot:CAMPEP_0116063232 /NCGR_PEP_ID=MMETSP0322-20121206/8289_1 /TAXON_ID=163516 /ORGANISM="Leptocylindrus danicus var. apora, Strain B651" /LENGTH=458 /DNA_ID=CAMNT_0003548805 /DNA_START=57 /DNA_END=1433 /DNA_ORIENTATION=-